MITLAAFLVTAFFLAAFALPIPIPPGDYQAGQAAAPRGQLLQRVLRAGDGGVGGAVVGGRRAPHLLFRQTYHIQLLQRLHRQRLHRLSQQKWCRQV
jgi:hypothetical protein